MSEPVETHSGLVPELECEPIISLARLSLEHSFDTLHVGRSIVVTERSFVTINTTGMSDVVADAMVC